jgi:predicted dehydrogenase
MNKLKIGFVGTGSMGQCAHLINYANLRNECEVVAVAEPRPKLAQLVAQRYGVPNVYKDHTELLAHGGVDAIVAAQPFRRHSLIIPDILRARIPVFTEKPVTMTVEAAEPLVKLGEELGVLHVIGNQKRSDPGIEYAKALIDEWKASGEMGPMKYIRATMPRGDWRAGADLPLMTDEPNPRDELEPFPTEFNDYWGKQYNSFVNYYIHQLNYIRFLLGEECHVTYADRGGVLLVMETANNVTATLEMEPYRTSVEWHESVIVAFEHGYVKIDLPAPLARATAGKVTVMRDNGKEMSYSQPILPNLDSMRKQAMNFLAAVRGERPPVCSAKEALEDLKLSMQYIRKMTAYSS